MTRYGIEVGYDLDALEPYYLSRRIVECFGRLVEDERYRTYSDLKLALENAQRHYRAGKDHFRHDRMRAAAQSFQHAIAEWPRLMDDEPGQDLVFFLNSATAQCYELLYAHSDAFAIYARWSHDSTYHLPSRLTWEYPWAKAANAVLLFADYLYRRKDLNSAKLQYEQIIPVDAASVRELGHPLYGIHLAPYFPDIEGLVSQIERAMGASEIIPSRIVDNPIQREVWTILANTMNRLLCLKEGLGYYQIPTPTLRYGNLYTLAEKNAAFAQRAVREFIDFRSAAERAELNERQLRDAAAHTKEAGAVEAENERVAQLEVERAEHALELAQARLELAKASHEEFRELGAKIAELEALLAWAHAAGLPVDETIGQTITQGRWLGIPEEELRRDEMVKLLVQLRSTLSYEHQTGELARAVEGRRLDVADAAQRIPTASAVWESARLRRAAAEAQHRRATETVRLFESRLIGPEFLLDFSNGLRSLARAYMERGIRSAKMAELAYNAEFGRDMAVIKSYYGDLIAGAGDFQGPDNLLFDLGALENDRAGIETKFQRIIWTFSLAERAPLALHSLANTGKAMFSTKLDQLVEDWPGLYNARIKAVEIEAEGLRLRPKGRLVSGFRSAYRIGHADGKDRIAIRYHKEESKLFAGEATSGSRSIEDQLDVFENMGTEGDWLLELPLGDNPEFRGKNITIRFVCVGNVDRGLELLDKERLWRGQIEYYTHSLRRFNSLKFDELLRTGTCDFEINGDKFPHRLKSARERKLERLRVFFLYRNQFARLPVPIGFRLTKGSWSTGSELVPTEGRGKYELESEDLGGLELEGVWSLVVQVGLGNPKQDLFDVLFSTEVRIDRY